MAKQTINIGTSANSGTGDPLRTAFSKTNQNFTELYDGKADLSYVDDINATLSSAIQTKADTSILGDIVIEGSIISTSGENQSLVIQTNGTGDIYIGADKNMIFDMNALSGKGIIFQDSQEDGYDDQETASTLYVGRIYHDTGNMVIQSDGTIAQASDPETRVPNYGGLSLANNDWTAYISLPPAVVDQEQGQIGAVEIGIVENSLFLDYNGLMKWNGELELNDSITILNTSSSIQASNGGELFLSSVSPTSGLNTSFRAYTDVNNSDNDRASVIVQDKTWQYTPDGSIVFPDSTVQTTAYIATEPSTYSRVVTPPASSIGANGDLNGDTAFDSEYMYYCTQDFGGESYAAVLQGGYSGPWPTILMEGVPQPLTGWQFDYNGTTYTVQQDATIINSIYWSINVSPSISVSSTANITIGPLSVTDIWKRVAWSNDTW